MSAPVKIETDAEFRARHVGAGEVAALFDAHPWLTKFELFHRKAGNIDTPDFNAIVDGVPENERIYFGVKMEPVIIEAACERWGYVPIDAPHRLSNKRGLGGHPDCIVTCPERGKGILEVKTADWLVAKEWGDEPPAHYLMQNLTYQGLAGVEWGDVIVLVGGNQLKRFQYDFRPKIYAEIESRVEAFWQTVKDNKPPKADYLRDGDAIVEVIGEPNGETVDLRHDNYASELADKYLAAKNAVKTWDKEADALKAELIEKIGEASFAMLPVHKISANYTKGSADKIITAEMVGDVIKGRRGYRRFDVKEWN